MELYGIVSTFPNIEFIHVKGHSGDPYNEEADRLATMACKHSNLPMDIQYSYSILR